MKQIILAILDGWGYSTQRTGNPIIEAKRPTFKRIDAEYPMVLLQASGLPVGLNWGNFGNSEVGHLNIGAGRIVQQYQTRIGQAIKDESFFDNPALVGAFDAPTVHLIGLLTSGNVHAEYSHILALVELVARKNHQHTLLHLFLDGKDSGLQEGGTLLKRLQNDLLSRQSNVKIATIIGRNFAMDRDNNWELTQQAYDLLAAGKGKKTEDFNTALGAYYEQGLHDTQIPALVSPSFTGVQTHDALIFFNFREDSIRQLYRLFAEKKPMTYLASFTQYLELPKCPVAFLPPDVKNNLAETVSLNGKQQFHIAETLKYAHVTYFFNGLHNQPYEKEMDVLIDSAKDVEVEPAMRSDQIAKRILQEMGNGYDLIVANFANADMLAHTGNYEATRAGVEAIDAAIGMILEKVLAMNAILLIT